MARGELDVALGLQLILLFVLWFGPERVGNQITKSPSRKDCCMVWSTATLSNSIFLCITNSSVENPSWLPPAVAPKIPESEFKFTSEKLLSSNMASLAAPVYTDSLKKRSRLSDSFDVSRKKRQRQANGQDDASDDADVAKYSQRHVEYFEQVKQADIARIRAEYEQFIMKRDGEFRRLGQELQHTQELAAKQHSEQARLQAENKLLKRAVGIQNQQKEEVQQENNALKQLATQAAEQMKRLEQANYTLRVHLQTSTSAGMGHHHQPPDVY